MPIQTKCPDCGRSLRVPDDLIGKNVRCPGCKGTFVAAADEAGPPPDAFRPEAAPHADRSADAFREAPPAASLPPPADETSPAPHRPVPRLGRDLDDFDDDAADDLDDKEQDEELRARRAVHRRARRVEQARARVKAPAIGLMVTGGGTLLMAFASVGLAAFFVWMPGRMGGPGGGGGPPVAAGLGMMDIQIGLYLVAAAVFCVMGALIIHGANRMRRLQSWGLSLAACILSIVTSLGSCCVMSLLGFACIGVAFPFGIWGIVVLNDRDVKASFDSPAPAA